MPADTPMVLVRREPTREQQLAMQKALLDNWPKLIGDDVCVNGRLLTAVYEAALSASPAREEEPCPVCGCEERTGAGYLQCECPAPSPGEGDAPVAWTPNGGEYGCPPILPPDTQVMVLRRSGAVTGPYPAGRIEWHHQGVPSDPMFYRITRPTPATPEGAELHLRAFRDGLRIYRGNVRVEGPWSWSEASEALAALAALQPQAGEGDQ
jgi:hypothetical protein